MKKIIKNNLVWFSQCSKVRQKKFFSGCSELLSSIKKAKNWAKPLLTMLMPSKPIRYNCYWQTEITVLSIYFHKLKHNCRFCLCAVECHCHHVLVWICFSPVGMHGLFLKHNKHQCLHYFPLILSASCYSCWSVYWMATSVCKKQPARHLLHLKKRHAQNWCPT